MGNVRDIRSKNIPITLGTYIDENGNRVERRGNLRFDLNAFAEIEEYYGNIESAMKELEQGSIKALRAILWAGLIHENMDEQGNPTITVRQVGSWIDITEVEGLSKALAGAMGGSLPEAEEAGAASPLAL